MFIGSDTRGENIARLLLWLLHQPGENTFMAAVLSRKGSVVLGYAVAAAMAAASARREAVLWLPCQPGENKHVCSSYGS